MQNSRWISLVLSTLCFSQAFAQTEDPSEQAFMQASLVLPPEREAVLADDGAGPASIAGRISENSLSISGPEQSVVGFEIINSGQGQNIMVPIPQNEIGGAPDRFFRMRFKNRARQDIQLQVTDRPCDKSSQDMESYFMFFPRLNIPALIEPSTEAAQFTVILPTGEPVIFDSLTKQIVGGVLREDAPVDLSPDRFKRRFAGISYTGTGTYFRLDSRGLDPRLHNTVVTVYQGAKTCKIPAGELFDQDEHSHADFRFPDDAGFNEFLKKKCQMSFL